ncbi:MAG: hypothetical protein JW959_10895 [Pirellulales bacterium]|nr:hypothetical protein [Pirellulales bacterium]
MRFCVAAGFCGLLLLSIICVGCGPELSERDLGTVVEGVPKVDGADKPYPMPQLGPESEEEEAGHNRH